MEAPKFTAKILRHIKDCFTWWCSYLFQIWLFSYFKILLFHGALFWGRPVQEVLLFLLQQWNILMMSRYVVFQQEKNQLTFHVYILAQDFDFLVGMAILKCIFFSWLGTWGLKDIKQNYKCNFKSKFQGHKWIIWVIPFPKIYTFTDITHTLKKLQPKM